MKKCMILILVSLVSYYSVLGQAPTANQQTILAIHGRTTLGKVTASGQPSIIYSLETQATHGIATICPEGSFTYEASSSLVDTLDQFVFRAQNGIGFDTAIVNVIVKAKKKKKKKKIVCDEPVFTCNPPSPTCPSVARTGNFNHSPSTIKKPPVDSFVIMEVWPDSGNVFLETFGSSKVGYLPDITKPQQDSFVNYLCVEVGDSLDCLEITHNVMPTYNPCIPTVSEWGMAFLILIFFFLFSFQINFGRMVTYNDLRQYTTYKFWHSELFPLMIKYSFLLPIISLLIWIYWNEFTLLDFFGAVVSYVLIVINIRIYLQYNSVQNQVNNSDSSSKLV